jgi:hypothetical protein
MNPKIGTHARHAPTMPVTRPVTPIPLDGDWGAASGGDAGCDGDGDRSEWSSELDGNGMVIARAVLLCNS